MKYFLLYLFFAVIINNTYAETFDDYIDRVEMYLDEDRYHEALASANEAIRINPNSAKAYRYLGISYFYLGDTDASLKYLHHAVELESTYSDAYINLANVYASIREYDRALENYNSAIYHDPENDRYYARRAYILGVMGDFERAILDYNEAIRLNGRNVEYFNHRGILHFVLRRDIDALIDFTRAIMYYYIDFGLKDFALHLHRGSAHFNLEMYDQALEDFTLAIELNPGHKQTYELRARVYRQLANMTDDFVQRNNYLQLAQDDLKAAETLE